MRSWLAAAIVALGLLLASVPAMAQRDAAPRIAPANGIVLQHWTETQDLIAATRADISRGGIRAVRDHVAALERAISGTDRTFVAARRTDNAVVVLADGQAEALIVPLHFLASRGLPAGEKVVVMIDPYPPASFLLGNYYNEIRKPADALRVLDTGLALPAAIPDGMLGETRPELITERGIALIGLKRLGDALAAYDDGLRIPQLENRHRGRMLRGRGYVLTELGRLDDAEQAYRDSLVSDPGNAIASRELAYIARLRTNPVTSPGQLQSPNMPSKQ